MSRNTNGQINSGYLSNDIHDERPLLRSFPRPSDYGTQYLTGRDNEDDSKTKKFGSYLKADVSVRWADLVLILCFFASGVIDAGAYNAYDNFASMQTGNTIFAALGVSNLPVNAPRLAWTKSVCSIFFFLLGSALISAFHRQFGPRKRWVLAASFTLQAVFIAISAYLVQSGSSSDSPRRGDDGSFVTTLPAKPGFPWPDLIPIGLLSFQASGKVVASRMLEYNSLTCVVVTTLYTDFISDPGFFSAGLFGNSPRNRRGVSAVMYFAGAVVGGAAAAHEIGFGGALWISAIMHFAIVAAWMAWRADDGEEA